MKKREANRHKKLAKKRIRSKDIKRKININRRPPSEYKEFKKTKLIPFFDENGKALTNKEGEVIKKKKITIKKKRVKIVKKDKEGKILPVTNFPLSRKSKLSKTEIAREKKASKNAIETAS